MALTPELIATIVVGCVVAIVGWLAKGRIERIEADHKTLASDVDSLGSKVQRNREEMLRDYIHEDRFNERLESVMRPVNDALARIERSTEDIFRRLDGKADRT